MTKNRIQKPGVRSQKDKAEARNQEPEEKRISKCGLSLIF
jgi:hypothetical protein